MLPCIVQMVYIAIQERFPVEESISIECEAAGPAKRRTSFEPVLMNTEPYLRREVTEWKNALTYCSPRSK